MLKVSFLFMTLLLIVPVPARPQRSSADRPGALHTPSRGSAERKAIMDGLRAEMKRLQDMELIFVVEYLKVHNGWAWTSVLPQSPDGSEHYEGVSALLHLKNGVWKVEEMPCSEEDNPDCIEAEGYFNRLRRRFPAAPSDIFPPE